jgi:hypothetical protein
MQTDTVSLSNFRYYIIYIQYYTYILARADALENFKLICNRNYGV